MINISKFYISINQIFFKKIINENCSKEFYNQLFQTTESFDQKRQSKGHYCTPSFSKDYLIWTSIFLDQRIPG